jgi:hypothetical protein
MFVVAGMFAVCYPGKMLKEYTKMDGYVDTVTNLHSYPVVEGTIPRLGV